MVEQQKEIKRMNEMLDYLVPKEVTRNILNEDNKVVSWEEPFGTYEEYIKSEREWRRMLNKLYNNQIDEEYRKYVRSKHPKIEDFHEHIRIEPKQAKKQEIIK